MMLRLLAKNVMEATSLYLIKLDRLVKLPISGWIM